MEEKIISIRTLLDNLVSEDNTVLSAGKILEVSKQLDILIAEYYKESSIAI